MSEKPLVIDKTQISKTKERLLTLCMGQHTLGASCPSKIGFSTLMSPQSICQFKDNWRRPWDHLDMDELYSMNYHITINPDPLNTLNLDVYDHKLMFKIFRLFLTEAKKNNLYSKIISVYEYGKQGKKYGKLHFHVLFKTHCCNKLQELALKYFGSNKKSRQKTTVVVKRITLDKHMPSSATPHDKLLNFREQCDYINKTYMRKESQNKHKCLYSNILKPEFLEKK